MKNNEWSELGEKIRDTVQSAIDSQDFSQLNKTINGAINGALDEVRNTFGGSPKQPGDTGIYEPQDSLKYRKYPNKEIRGNFKNANYSTVLGKRTGYDTRLFARFPAGRIAGPVMTSVGFTFMGLFLILAMSFSIAGGYAGSMGLLQAAGFMTVFALAGLFSGIKGIGLIQRVKRFKKYIQALNGRGFCALEDLAAKVAKPRSFVLKDVKLMIQKNMFLEGKIDQEQQHLIVTREDYKLYLEAREEQQKRRLAETVSEQQAAESKISEECRKILEEGNNYIRHIHECNEAIPGEVMSDKLSRLEEIMSRIFKRVEFRPEIAPELHKFMNYYLPTTTKLVDAYRDMDGQPVAGENIAATKKEIENTLDTINSAFENLLDRFFQDTAWDISSDISVMKTMLAQEGLTNKDFAAAAKTDQVELELK